MNLQILIITLMAPTLVITAAQRNPELLKKLHYKQGKLKEKRVGESFRITNKKDLKSLERTIVGLSKSEPYNKEDLQKMAKKNLDKMSPKDRSIISVRNDLHPIIPKK